MIFEKGAPSLVLEPSIHGQLRALVSIDLFCSYLVTMPQLYYMFSGRLDFPALSGITSVRSINIGHGESWWSQEHVERQKDGQNPGQFRNSGKLFFRGRSKGEEAEAFELKLFMKDTMDSPRWAAM